MFDTHVHLTEKILYDQIKQILLNAKANGINKMLCVGMNPKANIKAINLANKYNEVYAAVGIHPNEVNNSELNISLLEEQTANKKVIAVGEIGIDLYRSKDNLNKQIYYFKKQLDLALKLDLPVVIHSRNSANIIYKIIKEYKGLRGVMHCYSEYPQLLDKFIDLGFYIGIGGIVTFKNANVVLDIAKRVPLDKILIETDAPYLAPMPNRGKTNEPAFVKYTLKKLAEIKGKTEKEMTEITTANALRLFNKII